MSKRENIFKQFKTKSRIKQDAHFQTKETFKLVKEVLQEIAADYKEYLLKMDNSLLIDYKDHGEFGASLSFGGDRLVFQMHSNVFSFEEGHPLKSHSYMKEEPYRLFFGIINVYNFLSDSFKFNRQNDLGFLISRIFVNKDNHVFVEGKDELGYKYADVSKQVVSKELLVNIIESSIQYALEFDLFTPEFNKSQLVSVAQMQQLSKDQKMVTSKRLGFKMSRVDLTGSK